MAEETDKTLGVSYRAWAAAGAMAMAAVVGKLILRGQEPTWLDDASIAGVMIAVAVALVCRGSASRVPGPGRSAPANEPEKRGMLAADALEHARLARKYWYAGVALAGLTLSVGTLVGFDAGFGWFAYFGGALAAAAFAVSLGFVIAQHRALTGHNTRATGG